ncbi:MAG: hypothetical protein WCX97_00085 [Candidatus Magasanikbacteria bacterium]
MEKKYKCPYCDGGAVVELLFSRDVEEFRPKDKNRTVHHVMECPKCHGAFETSYLVNNLGEKVSEETPLNEECWKSPTLYTNGCG